MTVPRRLADLLGDVRALNEELRQTEPLARGNLAAAVEALEAGRSAAESVARLVPVAREMQVLTGAISEQAQEAAGVLRMSAGGGGGGGSRVGVESAGTLANKSGRSSGGGGNTNHGGSGRGRDGSPSVFGGLAPRPTDALGLPQNGPPQIVDGTGGAADPVFSLGSAASGIEAGTLEKAVAGLGRQLQQATAELRQAQAHATEVQARQLETLSRQLRQAPAAAPLLAPTLAPGLGSGLAFELRAVGGLEGG